MTMNNFVQIFLPFGNEKNFRFLAYTARKQTLYNHGIHTKQDYIIAIGQFELTRINYEKVAKSFLTPKVFTANKKNQCCAKNIALPYHYTLFLVACYRNQ